MLLAQSASHDALSAPGAIGDVCFTMFFNFGCPGHLRDDRPSPQLDVLGALEVLARHALELSAVVCVLVGSYVLCGLNIVSTHLLPVVLGVQNLGLTGFRSGRYPGLYRLGPCLPKDEAVPGLGLGFGFLAFIFAT